MNKLIIVILLLSFTLGCTNVDEDDVELARKALETGNPIHCAGIGDSLGKDICYSTIASKNRDSKVCLKISDIQVKNGCYMSLAMMTTDPKVCSKISEPELAGECKNSVQTMGKDVLVNIMS